VSPKRRQNRSVPVMFREADCVLITKVDLPSPICLWRWSASKRHIHAINPSATVFPLSASKWAWPPGLVPVA